jgi:hypothetical protein
VGGPQPRHSWIANETPEAEKGAGFIGFIVVRVSRAEKTGSRRSRDQSSARTPLLFAGEASASADRSGTTVEELAQHLDNCYEELQASGIPDEACHRRAQRGYLYGVIHGLKRWLSKRIDPCGQGELTPGCSGFSQWSQSC